MFTGIITEIGELKKISRTNGGATFTIATPRISRNLKIGDSIAIDGACHTIVRKTQNNFVVESMSETLRRTNFGNLKIGSRVNLERSVATNGRFDGHFVSGHVDGVAKILDIQKDKNAKILMLAIPKRLTKFVVEKGSIALDGVSLTIVSICANKIKVGIIPHTLKATNFGARKVGDKINIETDLLAKHVAKLISKK